MKKENDILDVKPIEIKTDFPKKDTKHRFYFIETKRKEGRMFQICYAETENVRPSLHQTLCVIAEDFKEEELPRWLDYGTKPMKMVSYIPRKPHFARKQNFWKNPRKSMTVNLEFNPVLRTDDSTLKLIPLLNELYMQTRHPRLMSDPNITWGFGEEENGEMTFDMSTFQKVHGDDDTLTSSTIH